VRGFDRDEFFFTPPSRASLYISLAHSRNYGLPALPRAFFLGFHWFFDSCRRWALTITRVNWMNAAHWSPSPAGWLLQFQRGHGPLWELACQRWSLTITRVNWINAALLSPSPAGWLLQFSAWAQPLVGAGLPAMGVNDNACEPDKRDALESIASRLAPTVSAWAWPQVGAGLPAMVVNDNACEPDKRGALESIASRLAPTIPPRVTPTQFTG
jgi:hypothetical protein